MSLRRVLLHDVLLQEDLIESELIDFLTKADSFYPVKKFDSTKDFLLNLILAICHDQAITLVDADFTDQEIINLGLSTSIGLNEELSPLGSNWGQDWLQALLNSKSKITLFTSGTTGLPKQVAHTISTLTRMVRRGDGYANDKWVLAYSPTHMAGLQVLFQALMNRNEILNVFGVLAEKAALTIQESKATHLSATPTFYRLLLGTGRVFEHIQRATVGGEKSSSELFQKMKSCFPNAKLNNIYASTELGSLFVSKGEAFGVLKHIRNQVRIGEDGELLLHTSLLADNSKQAKWYATGDLVEVLKHDPLEFKFLSRKTEMINVGGYKVNPAEVEELMSELSEVSHVRVFGKENSVLGNVLCSEVVIKEGYTFDKRHILSRLKPLLQDFKLPRIIKQVDKIDLTRTGKVSRK